MALYKSIIIVIIIIILLLLLLLFLNPEYLIPEGEILKTKQVDHSGV